MAVTKPEVDTIDNFLLVFSNAFSLCRSCFLISLSSGTDSTPYEAVARNIAEENYSAFCLIRMR